MEQSEVSLVRGLILFGAISVAIFAAWIVLGPGGEWIAQLADRLTAVLENVAEWYQRKLNAPSRLIAPAITIASGSYAIITTYRYAESRLHARLADYLGREEKRLAEARKQLRLIIERPNISRSFRQPIFLVAPLKRAVRELGWGSYYLPPQLGYVGFQLDASLRQLERQVALSKVHHRHLECQLATAHLLKGAMHVAEASAARTSKPGGRLEMTNALNHFQSALTVDAKDCEALEYASHVHVYLEENTEADRHLDQVLNLTDGAGKSLSRARAFRYKADLAAANGNNGIARRRLHESLRVLPNLHGEDRIEEAEIHENLADRHMQLRAHIRARSHWEIARALFSQIATQAALEGNTRVEAKLAQLDQRPDKNDDADSDDDDA